MKKKLVALFLAGAMLAGNAMAVMAEETELDTEVSTEAASDVDTEEEEMQVNVYDFDETQASFDGTWVPFEAGFQLYVPSDWNNMELSEEDAADGVLFYAQADDDTGWNLVVTATDVGTDYDTATIVEELSESYSDVAEALFNDIEAVTYTAEEEDGAGITLLDENGIMYTINCNPVSDDAFAPVALDILTSISKTAEAADAAEADTEISTEAVTE